MDNEERNKSSFIESPIAKWFSITIAFIGLGGFLYDHFVENNPDLTFTIIKEVSVLNGKANIPNIHISIDSIDVSETKSNLSIYTIKVENEGKQHITKNMYDGNININIRRGKYIGPPVVSRSSSSHIEHYLVDKSLFSEGERVCLPCIPLDRNDYYILDFVILHPIDSVPMFAIQGKVSGQKELVMSRDVNDKPSFWWTTFGGGFWVNLVRLLSYFIFGSALLIIAMLLIEELPVFIKRRKRKNRIHEIISHHRIDQQVSNDFQNLSSLELNIMYRWLKTSDDRLTKQYEKFQAKLKSGNKDLPLYIIERENQIIQSMQEKGYLKIDDGAVSVSKAMQNDFKFIYKKLKS